MDDIAQTPAPNGSATVGFTSTRRDGSGELFTSASALEVRLFERLAEMDFALSETRKTTHDLARMVSERFPSMQDTHALATRLAEVETRLDGLAEVAKSGQPQQARTSDPRDAENDPLVAEFGKLKLAILDAVGSLTDRVAATHTDVKDALASEEALPQDTAQQLRDLKDLVATLTPSLAGIAKSIRDETLSKVDSVQTELVEAVSALADEVQSTHKVTRSLEDNLATTLSEQFKHQSESEKNALAELVQSAVTEALAQARPDDHQHLRGLEEQIERLRSRPDPVLDLGPQRRSFAQFASVLARNIDRFDQIAADMSDQIALLGENRDAESDIAAKLDTLMAHIADKSLGQSVPQSETYPAPLAVLAQQRSFVRFQTANKATLDRFQTLFDAFAARFQALEDRLDAPAETHLQTAERDPTKGDNAVLLHPLAKLAEANLVLAASHAPSEQIISVHKRFLADLRLALAEHLANWLREHGEKPHATYE
ncbi:MAG: hypothetical protein AAFW64_00085 [Pseudomonadota bacterium]